MIVVVVVIAKCFQSTRKSIYDLTPLRGEFASPSLILYSSFPRFIITNRARKMAVVEIIPLSARDNKKNIVRSNIIG